MNNKEYPLFKFDCGCIIDSKEADRQREQKGWQKKLKCLEHETAVPMNRIGLCLDCGCEFEFHLLGQKCERCPACRAEHKRKYDLEYGKRYKARNYTGLGLYNKGCLEIERSIQTDLLPNPTITNPYRAPCIQGCQVFRQIKTRNNTACAMCEYRFKTIERIEKIIV